MELTLQTDLEIGKIYQIGKSIPPRMAKFKGRLGYRHFFVEWNEEEGYVCNHRLDSHEGLTFLNGGIIDNEEIDSLKIGQTYFKKSTDSMLYERLINDWEQIGKEK